MGNENNGIEVDGNAHNDLIGGPQPTFNIIPQNAISANGDNGVAITGNAHNITVSHSYIGTDLTGRCWAPTGPARTILATPRPASMSAPARYSNTIGSTDPSLPTVISGNMGDGVGLNGTQGNSVIGSYIGTDVTGAWSPWATRQRHQHYQQFEQRDRQ